MLAHKKVLALLNFTANSKHAKQFETFLTERPYIFKHPALSQVLAENNPETRQAKLANLLWHKHSFFKKDEKNLEAIFNAFESYLCALNQPSLQAPAHIPTFCTVLLKLSGLTAAARSGIYEAWLEAENIFATDGSIQPNLTIASPATYFMDLAASDQTLSEMMGNFYQNTFNGHSKITEENVNAAKQQAVIDFPRDRFRLVTRERTLFANPTQQDDTEEADYVLSWASTEEITSAQVNPRFVQSWTAAERRAKKTDFITEVLSVIYKVAPMDEAMMDFWKTCLLNQESPHTFPAMMFYLLIESMSLSMCIDEKTKVALNVLQDVLRHKELLFTYISQHEFQMSWAGEEDRFSFTIKNKYLAHSAQTAFFDTTQTEQTGTFRDISVTLNNFCLPIQPAEFLSQPIQKTKAYKDNPSLTYESCCKLFWKTFADYVLHEKARPDNLVTKENDFPALLMRLTEDPALKHKSKAEKSATLKAIAFHWLQLLDNNQQTELKEQMKWTVTDLLAVVAPEIKAAFSSSKSFFSGFWPASTPRSLAKISADCQSATSDYSSPNSTATPSPAAEQNSGTSSPKPDEDDNSASLNGIVCTNF